MPHPNKTMALPNLITNTLLKKVMTTADAKKKVVGMLTYHQRSNHFLSWYHVIVSLIPSRSLPYTWCDNLSADTILYHILHL